jgi:hypothetical protein
MNTCHVQTTANQRQQVTAVVRQHRHVLCFITVSRHRKLSETCVMLLLVFVRCLFSDFIAS